MNEEIKLNKQRANFSRRIKRKILLEIADGKNPKEIFATCAPEILKNNTNDKKYVAKLIHKWKKEMYKNMEILFISNYDVTPEMLDYEIKALDDDDSEKDILGIFKK